MRENVVTRGLQRDVVCSWLTNSALVYEPKCRKMLLPRGYKEMAFRSWLTNSALVCNPKCGGGGEGVSCWVSANEYRYSCTHGAQVHFGDLTL